MAGLFVRGGGGSGSRPEEIGPFESRLRTAFRGSAKEQKVAIEELRKERFKEARRLQPLASFAIATGPTPKPTLGASPNVFKSNLGGTARLTR